MITTDEYGRKVHKCSKCGAFCRRGAQQCRDCYMAQCRGIRSGWKCLDCGAQLSQAKHRRCNTCEAQRRLDVMKAGVHVIHQNGKTYERTKYKCQSCGIEKYSPSPRCRKCAIDEGVFRPKARQCGTCKCGKQLGDPRTTMCRQCDAERRKAIAKELKHTTCRDCGGKPDTRTKDGRCRACYSKFRQDEYARQNGELPLDRDILAAAKYSRKQKKCPTCGVKITTRECVACAVLNRVGEKGFR